MNTALKIVPPAEGRTIHATIDVWLTHQNPEVVGDTDIGMEIGKGLVRESMLILKTSAEREGYTVDARAKEVVY